MSRDDDAGGHASGQATCMTGNSYICACTVSRESSKLQLCALPNLESQKKKRLNASAVMHLRCGGATL